ncbi:MAG: ATP-binding cassette domain-containing protein [Lachnospiraceae bacterium]|nr:ATP-binding cassette domain-containing protein [Lachnospiraceae bacterium]
MSLVVTNLSKKYGDKTVVDHISFSLEHPGVYAFLGTNGAGKSTSLRMMLGMLAKDSGTVTWKGAPLDTMETNVGYLAEERGLYPKFTLMDQLMYFASLKNVSKEDAKKRIDYWVERLELTEYFHPPVVGKKKPKPMTADQLSKGNQQKVQLLAALISDPELLILDEPLSGLDPVNMDLFKQVIHEQVDAGKYIIMSSHQMEVVEEFCEDITILHHGKAVVQGNLNEIKKSYGRVNMFVKTEEPIDDVIEASGLRVINKTPNGIQLRVNGQEQADQFLDMLLTGKGSVEPTRKTIVRFELREPSLHEIFVEKAGENVEDEAQ